MFWDAGQARVAKAEHDRLTETFVLFRDAIRDALVWSGLVTVKGGWKLPVYLRDDTPPVQPPVQRINTPAARDRMLAQLNMMAPGIVRRDS